MGDQNQSEGTTWVSKRLTSHVPGKQEAILGIGGGVGPAAGVGLHLKIIENTITDGTDQSHFKVYHFSRSPSVPDRTKFLLGEISENPGEGMAEVMAALKAAAETTGGIAVAGVPCNTFHAPKVWSRFLARMEELGATGKTVRIVHMLEETVRLIQDLAPNCRKIGLMSTTGTRKSRVYRDLLEPKGYEVVEVPEAMQAEVHDTIYNKEWGIKAVSPVTEKAVSNFHRYTQTLIKQGAEAVILGCTEIPLAMPDHEFEGVPLVDPVVALARAMIALANPDKLQPLHQDSEHEQILFWRVKRRAPGQEIARAVKVLNVGRQWKRKASESHLRRQRIETAKALVLAGAMLFAAFALGRRSR
eukprot:gnl/MRDRNA2_/MRDRNA2_152299_c0_seq1.p1 gnl/MRDRNA2_/MRDRNA2_152299_c0~~gnl/MRDRNA2_/MRDRNA2_152299_c0_seq1.p1  ORF type:complete len:359 (+),score=61.68 gnl/MRDRNA2_/MRDRNA2_152299_c0_seq1:83-1159(+)